MQSEMISERIEAHHRLPQRLLGMYDRAVVSGRVDAWIDWESECGRYGVDPHTKREDLEHAIETSVVELTWTAHRLGEHAEDWPRWGRLGGLVTFARYGPEYYRLLGRRRWKRIQVELLQEYRAQKTEVAQ